MAAPVSAASIPLGSLSYDTFIGPGSGSPGITAFNLSNLTGIFGLPPDFPVSDPVTLYSATLTLTLSDLSQQVISFGDIGPGFVLDSGGNPVVQVPGDSLFTSALFNASLSTTTIALFDGTTFLADSGTVQLLLTPSSGLTLAADADAANIQVSGTVLTTVPEPGTNAVLLLSLSALFIFVRKKTVQKNRSSNMRDADLTFEYYLSKTAKCKN